MGELTTVLFLKRSTVIFSSVSNFVVSRFHVQLIRFPTKEDARHSHRTSMEGMIMIDTNANLLASCCATTHFHHDADHVPRK